MSNIRSKNTKPEMIVRSLVHSLGYRYRLHRKDLAGKPDMIFVARRKVMFIHGCFWHLHDCKFGKVEPKTNAEFWQAKRHSNAVRDKQNVRLLKKEGWQICIIWECELRNTPALQRRIIKFLER